jgi:hypothetical protein
MGMLYEIEDPRMVKPFTGGKKGFGEYDKKPEPKEETKKSSGLKLLDGQDKIDYRRNP